MGRSLIRPVPRIHARVWGLGCASMVSVFRETAMRIVENLRHVAFASLLVILTASRVPMRSEVDGELADGSQHVGAEHRQPRVAFADKHMWPP